MTKTPASLGLSWRHILRQRGLQIYQNVSRRIEASPFRLAHEPPEGRILRSLVKAPRPVIFDIGANLGSVTAMLCRMFPQATIHAFEPDPDTYTFLEGRHGRNARVHLHNMGVGSEPGTLRLNRYSISAANSFYPINSSTDWARELALAEQAEQIDVEVTTLDAFTQAQGLERIDLVKTDTQGFEPEILKGAQRLLSRQAIGALKLEVMPGQIYDRAVQLRDLDTLLAPHGYKLASLTGFNYGPDGELRYFDAYYSCE
jgi:FkbM family methyltransferase